MVRAGLAEDAIRMVAAIEVVPAATADRPVLPREPEEDVVSPSAVRAIVAAATEQAVVAAAPVDAVVAGTHAADG
jgi:hypothetical protein